jgi:ketosteroid isomerase-like protein
MGKEHSVRAFRGGRRQGHRPDEARLAASLVRLAAGTRRAMSHETVEVRNEAVRRFISAFENDTDAFRSTLHPEIEWFPVEENRTPIRGIKAAMRSRNAWLDTWDEHRLDVEEVVEEGDNVVALVHIRARGRGSGVEIDARMYAQFKVRNGKVIYLFDHEDRAAALEAAGLST